MKIAVEGCAHGELEKIYDCIEVLQKREGIQIDLLICCGDFQSTRNQDDLQCMAVPDKFKNMCTFYKYYSGEKRAPILTLFIGGNHEASNYLQELPYGGWVAPNIYYLGRAGVVQFGDIRIGGLSGIFKGRDYLQGLWECPPYNGNSLRSVYHIRALDVFRLKQLCANHIHIMLSHDWPRGITDYGDKEQLLKKKPFLREDIESNQLGSLPADELLRTLQPKYWFAAHLHCQFAAIVQHHDGPKQVSETNFLALDKCLPRRRHLQILDIPSLDGDKKLRHDPEWLAILRNTNHLMTVKNIDCHMPGPGGNERFNFIPNEDEKAEVLNLLGENIIITEDSFVKTAPAYVQGAPRSFMLEPISNPQTEQLCEKLGIDDPVQVLVARTGRKMKQPHTIILTQTTPSTPSRQFRLNLPSPTTPIVMDGEVDTLTDVSDTNQIQTAPSTPLRKIPLNLPSPTTPFVMDGELDTLTDVSDTNQTTCGETTFQTDASLDDSQINESPATPTVTNGKKTFKRRNQLLYTSDLDIELPAEDPYLQPSNNSKSRKSLE